MIDITQRRFPMLVSMVDLILEHPNVAGHKTLSKAVESLRDNMVHIWDKIEEQDASESETSNLNGD